MQACSSQGRCTLTLLPLTHPHFTAEMQDCIHRAGAPQLPCTLRSNIISDTNLLQVCRNATLLAPFAKTVLHFAQAAAAAGPAAYPETPRPFW